MFEVSPCARDPMFSRRFSFNHRSLRLLIALPARYVILTPLFKDRPACISLTSNCYAAKSQA